MVDTPIGTNSPNYTLVPGDVGATVFCRVTATNASGAAQAFSNAVGPVAAAGGAVPAITTPPAVTVAVGGASVSCDTGTWTNSPTGYAYQWYSDETPDVAISGATSATYVIDGGVIAPPTSPALTNLWAWWKADAGTYTDAGTTLATDGQAIQQWSDQGPVGTRHWTQTTSGIRPTLQTNEINTTLPVVRFDHDILSHFIGPDPSALTAGEIFIVVKLVTETLLGSLWVFGTSGMDVFYPYSTGNIYDDWGRTTRPLVGDPTPSLESWRVYNVSSIAGEWIGRIDTVAFPTDSTSIVGFPSATKLGVNFGGGGIACDIAEIIMYSAKCSDADRLQTVTYLSNKYGLGIV